MKKMAKKLTASLAGATVAISMLGSVTAVATTPPRVVNTTILKYSSSSNSSVSGLPTGTITVHK